MLATVLQFNLSRAMAFLRVLAKTIIAKALCRRIINNSYRDDGYRDGILRPII